MTPQLIQLNWLFVFKDHILVWHTLVDDLALTHQSKRNLNHFALLKLTHEIYPHFLMHAMQMHILYLTPFYSQNPGTLHPHTKSLVRNLRDNNIGLTKVYYVIGGFFGSMDKVPFNKRSLKSLCSSISRNHCQDDVKKTWLIKRCRTMNAKLRLVLVFSLHKYLTLKCMGMLGWCPKLALSTFWS